MISRKFANLYFLNTAARISFSGGRNAIRNTIPFNSLKPNIKILDKASFVSSINHVSQFHSSGETENSDKDENRKMLEKWLEMCKYEGEYIPEKITEEQFQNLMNAKTTFQRAKYLSYLVKKEWGGKKDKLRNKKQKELKKKRREESLKENLGHIDYGLWRNTMFAKTCGTTVMDFFSHRLTSAMVYGQPIVLDLDFDNDMKGREISSLASQIMMSISMNRSKPNPFNLMLCNVDFESPTLKALEKRMPSFLTPDYPMEVSSKSYLDMFPTKKLVYLTSNAKNEMTTLDPDAVYIVGGIVDLGPKKPLTLAKAKRERIKMQKLPLDRYHIFKHSKDLGIHVVMAILMDLQETGDWSKALENIPKRLISTGDEDDNRWSRKMNKFRN